MCEPSGLSFPQSSPSLLQRDLLPNEEASSCSLPQTIQDALCAAVSGVTLSGNNLSKLWRQARTCLIQNEGYSDRHVDTLLMARVRSSLVSDEDKKGFDDCLNYRLQEGAYALYLGDYLVTDDLIGADRMPHFMGSVDAAGNYWMGSDNLETKECLRTFEILLAQENGQAAVVRYFKQLPETFYQAINDKNLALLFSTLVLKWPTDDQSWSDIERILTIDGLMNEPENDSRNIHLLWGFYTRDLLSGTQCQDIRVQWHQAGARCLAAKSYLWAICCYWQAMRCTVFGASDDLLTLSKLVQKWPHHAKSLYQYAVQSVSNVKDKLACYIYCADKALAAKDLYTGMNAFKHSYGGQDSAQHYEAIATLLDTSTEYQQQAQWYYWLAASGYYALGCAVLEKDTALSASLERVAASSAAVDDFQRAKVCYEKLKHAAGVDHCNQMINATKGIESRSANV